MTMLVSFVATFNSFIYTLLAFVFPLYWSIKGLLRQYTVRIVSIDDKSKSKSKSFLETVSVSVSGNSGLKETNASTVAVNAPITTAFSWNEDDSEVPSTFIETTETEAETIKLLKTEQRVFNSGSPANVPGASTSIPYNHTTSSDSSYVSAWLHYWVILAVVHCLTGVYERIFLPFFGNSFFYHCIKYISIYWLAKNDAKAAQTLWNSVFAPFVAKHEQEVDEFVRITVQQSRANFSNFANSLVALRKAKIFKFHI